LFSLLKETNTERNLWRRLVSCCIKKSLGGSMELCCPYCKKSSITKKGKRKEKQGSSQKYYCTLCRKTFVKRECKNKTYNVEVIREAITLYNQGFTFEETANALNKRFKTSTTKSSIQRWIKEYQSICTYAPLRTAIRKRYGKDIIVSKNFTYQGLAYNFKYHKGKLEILGEMFPSLISYIRRCEAGCPPFFNDIDNRCSQLRLEVTIEKTVSENLVCRRAALALCNFPTKKKRHSLIENFMLINDDTTVAVEIPVWLWDKNLKCSIAGHIDLIQVSQGYVYILDYKPDAAREKDEHVASQLYLYASGLSFRAAIPLSRIRCAWFDDKLYVEFEPTKAKVRHTKTNNPIASLQETNLENEK
jgi:transposase-like protein